jgi:hypothetical protein
VLSITVFCSNVGSLLGSLFGFDPRVVAMLAEIFMLRLEAERRLAQDILPSSASRRIPFSPKSQFALEGANQNREEVATEEPAVRLFR